MIKSHGIAITKTYSNSGHHNNHNNHHNHEHINTCNCCNNNCCNNNYNEIKWDLDYNGEKGKIDMDIQNNNEIREHHIEFTNNDLEELLNVPTFNMPLETRLKYDFPTTFTFPKRKQERKSRRLLLPLHITNRPHTLKRKISHSRNKNKKRHNHNNHTSSIRRRLLTPKPKTYRIHLTSNN
jgi:hypothetical protein